MSLISKRDNTVKIRTCRICLDANRVDMVLLEEQNGWLKLFEFCFGFTLTIEDKPRLLCKICAEKVQGYVEFKEKCHKSHSLWKSVISDVKCFIVKHKNGENTYENANDPVAIETQIKDEKFDPHLDNDNYSNHHDNEMVNLSLTEIKTEFHKNGENTYENANDPVAIETQIKNEKFDPYLDNDNYSSHHDNEMVNLSLTEIKTEFHEDDIPSIILYTKSRDDENNKKKKDCLTTKANSKQINCKSSNSNCSVKSKEREIYTCAKCNVNYALKKCYLKHIKICRRKRSIWRKKFTQDYAYNLGRKYNDQNIGKVNQESQIEIIGNQEQIVPSSSCGLCNINFATTKDVCVHLNDHWSNNDLACKLCDFVGIDLAATAAHRYSHFPRKDVKDFLCHICEKNKLSLLALHFHYRQEHLKKPGGYCSRCHKEYNNLRHWKKHEVTHCARKHVCDICGKGFHFKYSIREHIINHMRLNKSICDICGKTFARQSYLKLHKETVHCESGPLECYHCDRTFKSEFTLLQHQKNMITREKTLKCEVCNKAFITPNTLKLHMVTHSDERPYGCNICGSRYKYKSYLTHHQLKHYKDHPQCSICKKTFSDSFSLKRHSSVHTGVRRYNCSVTNCTKSFYSKKLMLAHLELRHKDENVGEK